MEQTRQGWIRCGLAGPRDPVRDAELLAQFEAMRAEKCRRCGHTFDEHPNANRVACAVEGCSCHCFWEQPPPA